MKQVVLKRYIDHNARLTGEIESTLVVTIPKELGVTDPEGDLEPLWEFIIENYPGWQPYGFISSTS